MPGPRYEDWTHVRVQGDRAKAAPYLPYARKMLGYLAEQRAGNGVKTQELTKRMSDGTLIVARFIGEQAVVDIAVGGGMSEKVKAVLFSGLVVRPRTQTLQNAFGTNGHCVITATPGEEESDPPVWSTFYYDESYVPVGEPELLYTQNKDGEALLAGLSSMVNTTWTDGEVVVCWQADGSQGGAGQYAQPADSLVFHNGRLVINAATFGTGGFGGVLAACVRKYEGVDYLLFVWQRSSSFQQSTFHIYRAKLTADVDPPMDWVGKINNLPLKYHPRWKTVTDPADVELLKSYTPTDPADHASFTAGVPYGAMSFNQRGDELRAIRMVDCEHVLGTFYRSMETVVSLPTLDPDEIVVEVTERGVMGVIQEHHREWPTVVANRDNVVSDEGPTGPPFMPAVGSTHNYTFTTRYSLGDGYKPSPFYQGPVNVLEASESITDAPIQSGAVPLIVEFEDNVPVYLYYEPTVPTTSATTFEAEMAQNPARTGSTQYSYSETSPGSGIPYLSQFVNIGTASDEVSSSSTRTLNTGSGYRLFAVDKAGVTWFDRSVASSFSSTTTYECAGEYAISWDITENHTYPSGGSTVGGTTGSASIDMESVYEETNINERLQLEFIDMRHRSISAVTTRTEQHTVSSFTWVGASSPTTVTIPPSLSVLITTAAPVDGVQHHTAIRESWFYGEQVIDTSETKSIPPTASGSTQTLSMTVAPKWVWMGAAAWGGLPISIADQTTISNGLTSGFSPGPTPYDIQNSTSHPDDDNTSWLGVEFDDFIGSDGGVSFPANFFGSFVSQSSEESAQPAGSGSNEASKDGGGRAVVHRGMFAYSFLDFDLSGRSNLSTARWVCKAGHRDSTVQVDLNDLVHEPTATLYSYMWPISACLYGVKPAP